MEKILSQINLTFANIGYLVDKDEWSQSEVNRINSDLYLISVLVKNVGSEDRAFRTDIDWPKLERLSFAKLGSGFSEEDLKELLVEDKFELLKEFEKLKGIVEM